MNEEHIHNIPLFANLNSREQRAISKAVKLEKYRQDEVLFKKDGDSDALYIIETGRISLSINKKTTLATLGPGSLLGEADFLHGVPRATTAQAVSAVSVWVLDDNTLKNLIGNNPQLGLSLSQALEAPIIQMTDYLSQKLASVSAMQPLSNKQQNLIARHLIAQKFEAGETIFNNGTPPAGLFLVEEGIIRLIGESDNDYTELGEGELFGEMAVLSGKLNAHTAQAAQETVVWHLSQEDFVKISRTNPEIRTALSSSATARLSHADQLEAANALKKISLFSQLSAPALEDAASRLLLRHLPAGEQLFKVGDPGDAMYIIESGQLELTDEVGKAISRPSSGNHLDELALMTGKNRATTATALTDTNLWAMYRPDFDSLLVKHPKLSTALSQSLREQLNAADSQFIEKHLKKLAVLGGLSRLQLDELSARLQARRCRTGDIIYQEGQTGQELYFIENGQVERFTTTPTGSVALPVLGTGDFLGEASLLSGRAHATTARAQTDLDLWFLSKTDFDDLVYKYPNLSATLNKVMSERLVETMDIIRNNQGSPVNMGQPRPVLPPRRPMSATVAMPPQSRSMPPVRVRPVAPPPPNSRPNPPISRGQKPQRATSPVRAAKSSTSVKSPSRAARPVSKTQTQATVGINVKSVKSSQRSSAKAQRQSRPTRSGPASSASSVTRKRNKNSGGGILKRIDGVSSWYARIPIGTRLGLFLLVLLLIWMCGIVGPASIISALAATILDEQPQLIDGTGSADIVGEITERGLVAALPFVETTTPTPTVTPTASQTPTPSATVTQTPIPTFTPTPTETPTPVDTPTQTPTPLPTSTPTRAVTNTPVYRAPTNTPTPEPTATPDVDFLVAKVRKLTPCENEGKHHIYIRVIDRNGIGLNNIPVRISWGPNSGDGIVTKTEAKDKGDGFIEFAMFKGTYSVEIMGAKTQVASGITPDFEVDEPCLASGNGVGNSLFHASFEVVFQRTY